MDFTDAKTYQADRLRQLTSDIFTACEVSPEDARIVADHLVGANLKGLDSHGVLRIPQYVGNIRKNEIVPGAGIETVRETPTTALLDLNWNFGQIGARTATGMAVARAGRQGLGSVALYRTQHVGCLSLYTEAIAGAGMVGLAVCSGGSPSGHWVAPWGGREGRIGTNPISMAAPTTGRPILFDAATSAISEGKVRLSRDSGKNLPDTWLVDAAGRPSVDPNALYRPPGGAILPVGGALGYKGFGFAMMAQVLSTVLTGANAESMGGESNNFWILAIDIVAFTSPGAFRKELDDYVAYAKSAAYAEGFERVLMPGELDYETEERRAAEGIPIADGVWAQIETVAADLGVAT